MVLARMARIGGVILAVYLLLSPIIDTTGLGWETYLVVIAFLGGLASLGWGLYLRKRSRCPRCRKPWAGKILRKEGRDVFYRDVLFDGLPPVPHVRYRVHHQCKHCGHRWISTQAEKPWNLFV
jgi:hypothetical protein